MTVDLENGTARHRHDRYLAAWVPDLYRRARQASYCEGQMAPSGTGRFDVELPISVWPQSELVGGQRIGEGSGVLDRIGHADRVSGFGSSASLTRCSRSW